MKITRFTLTLVLVLLGLMASMPNQALQAQDAPPPPYDIPPGHTYINPNPGISAPASTNPDEIGTNTVSGSRGYGDAWMSYFLQSITGWGQTWLNNNASSQHNICAQLVTLDVNGWSSASTPSYSCKNASAGGSITSSATAHGVACGSFVAARTKHRIEQTGYSWENEDTDAYSSFCN